MLILFLMFVFLPILEIMLIIEVAGSIGGWHTFLLVIITAFVGAYFVKKEGINTLNSLQTKAAKGEVPGTELVEGICLLVAGVLLVTPGFVTDIFGLLLTFPLTRRGFAKSVLAHLQNKQATGQNAFYFNFQQSHTSQEFNQPPFTRERNDHNGDVFEGEFQDMTDADKRDRLK